MLVQAIAGRDRWMTPGELIEVFIDECRKGSGRHRPAGDAGDRDARSTAAHIFTGWDCMAASMPVEDTDVSGCASTSG